jgi:hypothetical protein
VPQPIEVPSLPGPAPSAYSKEDRRSTTVPTLADAAILAIDRYLPSLDEKEWSVVSVPDGVIWKTVP